jgi:hypothetical protein
VPRYDAKSLTRSDLGALGFQKNQPMNRREAIIAGAVGIAAGVTAVENAHASTSENPEVDRFARC